VCDVCFRESFLSSLRNRFSYAGIESLVFGGIVSDRHVSSSFASSGRCLLKTLPLGVFNLFSFLCGLSLWRSAALTNSLFFSFLTIIFLTFLLSYNINLYVMQSKMQDRQNLFDLFRSSFFFTMMHYHKGIGILVLAAIGYFFTWQSAPSIFYLFFVCLGPCIFIKKCCI